MTSALLLLTYAVVAGTWGASRLLKSRWPAAAPRLAIAAWHALASSVLLAIGAAGLALTVTITHVSTDLTALFALCAEGFQHGYAAPAGDATAAAGLTLFLTVVFRTVWCACRTAYADTRERRARVAILDLVGSGDVVPGALVIDHAAPYAFCVGGRRHRIVVTTALLRSLCDEELRAVLAHEAAHLRQHHHVALAVCRALFDTLTPLFPAFRSATPLVRLYAELSADDSARIQVGARPLRAALTALACGPTPVGTLAASAHDVEARLVRLSAGRRLGVVGSTLGALGIGAAVLVPFTLAAAPLVSVAWKGLCAFA